MAESVKDQQLYLATRLLPIAMLTVFVIMVAVAEKQVRSSPKWPPPAKHELGGWEIEPPKVLYWAAGLSLPATIPIVALSEFNYAFGYAFDDHRLIVYVPWIVLVYLLWYLVSQRLRLPNIPLYRKAARRLAMGGQIFVTLEVLFVAALMLRPHDAPTPVAILVAYYGWAALVLVAWVHWGLRRKYSSDRSAHSGIQVDGS